MLMMLLRPSGRRSVAFREVHSNSQQEKEGRCEVQERKEAKRTPNPGRATMEEVFEDISLVMN